MLQAAFHGFREDMPADFAAFTEQEASWLPEYALLMAIKAHFDDRPWLRVAGGYPPASAAGIEHYRSCFRSLDVQFHCFCSMCSMSSGRNCVPTRMKNGVQIIGDVPIYVPLDSADVWAHPENFQLGRTRRPKCVAGCPPDGFSKKRAVLGQSHLRLGAHGAKRFFRGGSSESARRDEITMWCASTISAASRGLGAFPPSTRPRARDTGSRVRA